MSVVTWVHAYDCDPPHGLDMDSEHDRVKVWGLVDAFTKDGFDQSYPALVGYPLDGRVQLLSGTHRHRAALTTGTQLPVVLWLRSDVERAWGDLDKWLRVIEDVPVRVLETFTREDVESLAGPRAARWAERVMGSHIYVYRIEP